MAELVGKRFRITIDVDVLVDPEEIPDSVDPSTANEQELKDIEALRVFPRAALAHPEELLRLMYADIVDVVQNAQAMLHKRYGLSFPQRMEAYRQLLAAFPREQQELFCGEYDSTEPERILDGLYIDSFQPEIQCVNIEELE